MLPCIPLILMICVPLYYMECIYLFASFTSWSCFFNHCIGNNVIWCWLFLGCHWMAYNRDDSWGLWLCCTFQVSRMFLLLNVQCLLAFFVSWLSHASRLLTKYFSQWVLANIGSFPAKDSYCWLALSAAFCQIGMSYLLLRLLKYFWIDSVQLIVLLHDHLVVLSLSNRWFSSSFSLSHEVELKYYSSFTNYI